ncbi:MAG: flagellar hook-associated protein FlgK [Syntrophomonadaceae bacterium]|nr:flagellar hook-associated protein FlgK [Syntrophomonadaceae bacterium]
MSLFFGNNIALKGMMAQQAALNVALNNVANANTEGYSRQRVDLQASNPISGIVYGEQLGSGVDVANIGRIRDEFLDYQLRTQTSELKAHTTVHDTLNNVEIVFNETARDIGLSSDLNKFWNAWQDVSVTPASPAVRTVLMESAVTLSDHMRQIYSQLSGIREDINTQISQSITAVESIAARINTLNTQIANSSMNGETPNDLLDSRDIMLDKLAEIGNITVTKRGTTGAVDVKLGEHTIVDQAGVHTDEFDPATVKGGTLGALVKLGGAGTNNPGSVQYYMDKLNIMAASLANNVNALHVQGINLDGETGESNPGAQFFTANDGEEINAANLTVNSAIQNNVYKIAASNNEVNLTGNGEMALALANLRTTSQISDSEDGSGQKTIDAFYQETVTQLGSKVNEAESNVINQQTLVTNLSLKKESVSGVSLDEETANTVVYQHAFNACARVISIIDQMLDTVINRMKA